MRKKRKAGTTDRQERLVLFTADGADIVQYVAHKSICIRPYVSRGEVFVLC